MKKLKHTSQDKTHGCPIPSGGGGRIGRARTWCAQSSGTQTRQFKVGGTPVSWVILTFCLVFSVTVARGNPKDGQWLLDYGQAHGLAATNPQPADAEFILIWLDAALELSPDLWEAHHWRSDLLFRLNRDDEAIENLTTYCTAEPKDAPALLTLLGLQIASKQNVEDRIALYQKFLARPQLPKEVASDIHLQIASLLENRGDHEKAMGHVRKAIDEAPHNLTARILLNQLQGQSDSPEAQVDLMLRSIALDPNSPQNAWQLAIFLKQHSLLDHALNWLQIASDIWKRATDGQPPPPDLLTEIARIHLLSGKPAEAIAKAKEALSFAPQFSPASIVIIQAAKQLGRTDLVESESNKLTTRFRELESNPQRADAQTCHTVALYHLNIQPDQQKAVRYALLAVQKDPNDPRFRQTLGQAYEFARLHAEAIEVLTTSKPLTTKSSLALANAQKILGDDKGALQTLTEAARFNSENRSELKIAIEKLGATIPPTADLSPVKQRLTEFDMFPLLFVAAPSKFIEFGAHLSSTTCKLGESLTATITLKNKGNHEIVLGSNRMLNPKVTVSLIGSSRLGPHLQNYLTIDLLGEAILNPGESRSVTRALTTAAGRLFLNAQPQHRMDLKARFILDPVLTADGSIVPRYPDIKPVDAKFMRLPVDASPAGLTHIRENLRSPDESTRLIATETLVSLIIERQDSMINKPHLYRALPIDINELTIEALTTLRDPDPSIRARTLTALSRIPTNQPTIQAAAPLISDNHWLVRLLAVEFFAKKQGPVFLPVLERLANDPNPIVARLATLYRDQAREMKNATQQ